MASIAATRLQEEWKAFQHHHPSRFAARPLKNSDGSIDLFNWDALIPGPKGTPWEQGLFKLKMNFPNNYPLSPPKCQFDPPIFHVNVYPSGTICSSILDEEKSWHPSVTIQHILLCIFQLLDSPNIHDPAQAEAFAVFVTNRNKYYEKVREQAINTMVNVK